MNDNIYKGYSKGFFRKVVTTRQDGILNVSGKDYYKEFGISKNASGSEIKRIYYSDLSQKFHVDKIRQKFNREPTEQEKEKWEKISEAYLVLSYSESRKEYDGYYEDIENDELTDNFRSKIKSKLMELSKKTDPSLGVSEGSLGEEGGVSSDISKWSYLFPSETGLESKLKKLQSKKEACAWACRIVHIYNNL